MSITKQYNETKHHNFKIYSTTMDYKSSNLKENCKTPKSHINYSHLTCFHIIQRFRVDKISGNIYFWGYLSLDWKQTRKKSQILEQIP